MPGQEALSKPSTLHFVYIIYKGNKNNNIDGYGCVASLAEGPET